MDEETSNPDPPADSAVPAALAAPAAEPEGVTEQGAGPGAAPPAAGDAPTPHPEPAAAGERPEQPEQPAAGEAPTPHSDPHAEPEPAAAAPVASDAFAPRAEPAAAEPVAEAVPEPEPQSAVGAELAPQLAPEALIAADIALDEPAVGEPAGLDPIDAILLEIERLNVRVEELSRLSLRHVDHIDKLHAENQQLRAGELRQAISPLLRALVRYHDNVAKLAESAGDEGREAESLRIVRTGLLNVLSMAGVEVYEVGPKEKFDPARHQGVSRAETEDPDLDGTVAQMRRCGFVAEDGRVIRPAEVDVYRVR